MTHFDAGMLQWFDETRDCLRGLGYEPIAETETELLRELEMIQPSTNVAVVLVLYPNTRALHSRWRYRGFTSVYCNASVWVSPAHKGERALVFVQHVSELPRLLQLLELAGCDGDTRIEAHEDVFGGTIHAFDSQCQALVRYDAAIREGAVRSVRRYVNAVGSKLVNGILDWSRQQPQRKCKCGASAPEALFRTCRSCNETFCYSCVAGPFVRLEGEDSETDGYSCFWCMQSGRVVYPSLIR